MDFTDLNKACPKDPFSMPRIDRLVDATVGHPWMSFLDVFQGYHQIPLALDDQERTTFVTPVYIDDMVVKSKVCRRPRKHL